MSGGGVDVVYECSATQTAIDQSIQLLNKGGMLTLIGMPSTPTQAFDTNGIIMKEAFLSSNFRYRHNYPTAIAAIASGTAPISKVVSHRFPLEKLGEAIELNIADKNTVTKIVVEI